MVDKLALKVCPKAGCGAIASGDKRNVKCPKHGDLLVGRVYEKQDVLQPLKDLAKRYIYKSFSKP